MGKNWLLLSSGARKNYLRDIMEAAALPDEEEIQFRYEKNIVAPTFAEMVKDKDNSLIGATAYVTYINVQATSGASNIVPIREAEIVGADLVGSTIVVNLKLKRYIDLPLTSRQSVLEEIMPYNLLPYKLSLIHI